MKQIILKPSSAIVFGIFLSPLLSLSFYLQFQLSNMLSNFSLVTVFFLALAAIAAPLEHLRPIFQTKSAFHSLSDGIHITNHKPVAFASSRTPSKSSPYTLSLTKRSMKGLNTRSAAHHLKKRGQASSSGTLEALLNGTEYVTSIMFGNQTFDVVVDTGSSDTWVPQAGFRCYDQDTHDSVPTGKCGFGPELYKPSSTFKRIPGEEFYVSYGDGEWGSGYTGNESVTLAGITVNQKVGVMDEAAWRGENITSGLVGLSYPGLYVFPPVSKPCPNTQAS